MNDSEKHEEKMVGKELVAKSLKNFEKKNNGDH
jgi:hypothetical protein